MPNKSAGTQLPAGQRSSIAFMISSAHRPASAIALIVAGILFPPSNCASLRGEDTRCDQQHALAALVHAKRSISFVFCSPHEVFGLRKLHLWSTPVVFPFYRSYDVLRQSSAACKALKVLKTTVLKRLASAVQLRPWPPNYLLSIICH
jgi:hypothetical protein